MKTRKSVINTLSRAISALVLAAVIAPSVQWLQELIAGGDTTADPESALFSLGLRSVILTTLLGIVLRHPGSCALGGFVGQSVYVLSDPSVEYPGSTALALVIYGLIPASITAAGVTLILRFWQPKVRTQQNSNTD